MDERGIQTMVQQIIPGGDRALVGYLAFWDGGREIAWLTKRKLRQNPPGFGDGSLQVSAELPEVAELSRRLLRALDYRGFVGVDLLAYLALRRSKAITTREWLRSIRGAEAKALGAWDDPVPLIVGLKRFLDRVVSAVLRIIVSSWSQAASNNPDRAPG